MNLKKNVPWGDHYNLQLRADSFNIFNHPNFATPNATISNSSAGTVTGISGTHPGVRGKVQLLTANRKPHHAGQHPSARAYTQALAGGRPC